METATDPQATQLSEKKRSPRPKAAKKQGPKFSRFDEDVLKLVRRGEGSAGGMARRFGVDESEVRKRLDELASLGIVVFGTDADTVKLTVEGYNSFTPKSLELSSEKKTRAKRQKAIAKETLEKKENTIAPTAETTPTTGTSSAAAGATAKSETNPTALPIAKPLEPTANAKLPEPAPSTRPAPIAEVPKAETRTTESTARPSQEPQPPKPRPPRRDDIDLMELLRKGAPNGSGGRQGASGHSRVELEKRLDNETAELLKKTVAEYEKEKCELCRAGFKLAVSGGNPKYGHCFCGAAYHKDCYESLAQGGGACVRCGRKLELVLDRQSQEAVAAIRKLFE